MHGDIAYVGQLDISFFLNLNHSDMVTRPEAIRVIVDAFQTHDPKS